MEEYKTEGDIFTPPVQKDETTSFAEELLGGKTTQSFTDPPSEKTEDKTPPITSDIDLNISSSAIAIFDRLMSFGLLKFSLCDDCNDKDFALDSSIKKELSKDLAPLIAEFKRKPNKYVVFALSVGTACAIPVMKAYELRKINLSILEAKERIKRSTPKEETIFSDEVKINESDETPPKQETRGRKKKVKNG